MSRLSLILVLVTSFSLFSNTLQFPSDKIVGNQPNDMLFDEANSTLHIFCNGIDVNFNGIYDESDGDVKASWWTLDAANPDAEAQMVREFEGYMPFPLNVNLSVDGEGNVIIPFAPGYNSNFEIIENSIIKTFSIGDYSELSSIEAENSFKYIEANTVNFNNVNANVTLIDDIDDSKDGVNLSIDFLQLDTLITTGINPVDMDYLVENGQTLRVAVLNNGPYSTNQSTLNLITFNSLNDFSIETINVGTTANSLIIDEGKVFIAANGSHEIYIYNLNTKELISFPTPTGGFNGPREVLHNNNELIVTTYSQDIITMDAADGSVLEMHRTKGLNEASLLTDNKLYVSVPLKGDYSANNLVTEFSLSERIDKDWRIDAAFTGYQPVQLHTSNDEIYIICNGIDYDFNGEFNTIAGEQYPSIWRINMNNSGEFDKTELITSLEIPIAFPYRGSKSETGFLIPSGNSVFNYDIERDTLEPLFAYSNEQSSIVTVQSVGDYLICGARVDEEPDKLIIFNSSTDEVLTVDVDENINEVDYIENTNGINIYVLSEGLFSEGNSTLQVFSFNNVESSIETLTTIEVGDTGNDLQFNNDKNKLAVTVNGSHEVHIINTETQQVENTISTGTEGFNGPRESTWDGNRLLVSTYNSEIIMFDTEPEKPIVTRLDNSGFSEDILSYNQFFISSNIFHAGYESSNMIQSGEFVLNSVSSFESPKNKLRVYPLPSNGTFTVESENILETVSIFSISGNLVYQTQSLDSTENFDMNLPSGNYIIVAGEEMGRLVIQ